MSEEEAQIHSTFERRALIQGNGDIDEYFALSIRNIGPTPYSFAKHTPWVTFRVTDSYAEYVSAFDSMESKPWLSEQSEHGFVVGTQPLVDLLPAETRSFGAHIHRRGRLIPAEQEIHFADPFLFPPHRNVTVAKEVFRVIAIFPERKEGWVLSSPLTGAEITSRTITWNFEYDTQGIKQLSVTARSPASDTSLLLYDDILAELHTLIGRTICAEPFDDTGLQRRLRYASDAIRSATGPLSVMNLTWPERLLRLRAAQEAMSAERVTFYRGLTRTQSADNPGRGQQIAQSSAGRDLIQINIQATELPSFSHKSPDLQLLPLDENAVMRVANALISKSHSTTTLEVKKQLRDEGYYARQGTVSAHMSALASTDKLQWTNGPGYRVYTASKPSIPSLIAPVGSNPDYRPNMTTPAMKVRTLLQESLRSDSDFDAFCQGYFPDAFGRFTDGMDRVRKITVLLQHAKPADVEIALASFSGATAHPIPAGPSTTQLGSSDAPAGALESPAKSLVESPSVAPSAPTSTQATSAQDSKQAEQSASPPRPSDTPATPPQGPSQRPGLLVKGALATIVVGAVVLIAWWFAMPKRPSCEPGRQPYEEHCVLNQTMDFVDCVKGSKVSKAVDATERAFKGASGDSTTFDAKLNSNIEREFASLSKDELELVMKYCADAAQVATVRVATSSDSHPTLASASSTHDPEDRCAKPAFDPGAASFQIGTAKSVAEANSELSRIKKLFIDSDLNPAWAQTLERSPASGGAAPYLLRATRITVPAGRALCRWLRDCKGSKELCEVIP